MNQPFSLSPNRQPLKKETILQKWFFIFKHGSLYWGAPVALFSSILIQLSYSSFELNEAFFEKLPERLLLSLMIFMLAGCGLGHWRWSYYNHKLRMQS